MICVGSPEVSTSVSNEQAAQVPNAKLEISATEVHPQRVKKSSTVKAKTGARAKVSETLTISKLGQTLGSISQIHIQ